MSSLPRSAGGRRILTMSMRRRMEGGCANRESLDKGANGRNLCRWCDLEVPGGRITFCSEWCVNEWKLRSDPGYLRQRVLERDRGVCALCSLDTLKAWRRICRIPLPRRTEVLREWGIRPGVRKSLWDADHIVPVSRGGGECDLDNLRTLCLKCHRLVTGELLRPRQAELGSRPGGAVGTSSEPDCT